MAELAILGHPTRGNEVVELLEMLGGKNIHDYVCNVSGYAYIINKQGIIGFYIPHPNSSFTVFTLEEFLEKFPYKVGDNVMTDDGDKANIVGMVWDNDIDDVFYETQICNKVYKYPKELLQPYKEETMDKVNKAVFDANAQCCDIMNHLIKEKTMEKVKDNWAKWDLPDGYEFQDKNGNIINTSVIRLVKKQPQYPKTYVECCEVLGIEDELWFVYEDIDANHINPACISNYRMRRLDLYHNLEKLIICRDAYWKIAGEQMGLGKPWKPDWNNISDKYCVYFVSGDICSKECQTRQCPFAFPTPDMRDAFYENFKDLIDDCKELL